MIKWIKSIIIIKSFEIKWMKWVMHNCVSLNITWTSDPMRDTYYMYINSAVIFYSDVWAIAWCVSGSGSGYNIYIILIFYWENIKKIICLFFLYFKKPAINNGKEYVFR